MLFTAAHAAHIVHRDIKPENIMIRPDGYLKILDFGLAKLVEQKAVGLEESTIHQNQTAKGIILGTVNYMSPEQAKSEKIDGRTDIFSFGVLIYEMIAGRTPFAGDSVSETFANLMNKQPQPLARYAANVPDELQRIVRKALTKDKEMRYQTARDLLIDLKNLQRTLDIQGEMEHLIIPNRMPSGQIEENAAEIFNRKSIEETNVESSNKTTQDITNSSSLDYAITQAKSHKLVSAMIIGIVLLGIISALAYFAYFAKSSAKQIESIAVMPFVNESGNADTEYLSDGMTESLINRLSQLPKLSVKARSSVFRYKGKVIEPQTVGNELSVQAILNGRVVVRGDNFTLSLELVDAETGNQIWGEQYNRKQIELVSLQNEIARDVTSKLQIKMSGAEQQQLTKNYTKNAEAYQLFLKGRYHTEKYTPQDLRKAMAYFQQAIALDPSFAAGYANLGGNYYLLAGEEDFPVRESMLKAKENVLKAISLDDRVSIAHEVLGLIFWHHEYDYAAGERELKRALEIDPNDSSARETYSRFLSSLDKHEEALAEAQRAAVISPLSPSIISSIGSALLAARRYDEAVVQFKKSIELDAYLGFVHSGLAATYQMQQNYAESIEERAKVAEILGDKKGAAFIRESFAQGGWQGFLRAMTENSQAPKVKPMIKAGMYAELGNKDKAFEILNSLYEERSPSLLEIKVNPTLDSLRDDPRFQELLRKVGFPP